MQTILHGLLVAKVTFVLYLLRFLIDLMMNRSKPLLSKFLDRLKLTSLDFCFIGLGLFAVAACRVKPPSSYHVRYPGDQSERTFVFAVLYVVFYVLAAWLTEHAGIVERRRRMGKPNVKLTLILLHSLLIFLAGVMFITGALSL